MTLTTFDRAIRSIHYAHEIAHGSPLSQTVERAQRAFEEPIEIVYEVEGGYIAQTAAEAVFVGDDGEFALTDIYEAAKGKRDYRKEYDDYHAKPGQKKNRAARNAARASKGLQVGDKREVDHKVPLSKGGDNEDSNLRVVSRETNRSKGDSEESVDETISRNQLNSLERALDKLFAAANIDVEFTKHFMDRVNDARNVTDITIEELAGLFRETWKKFRKTLEKSKPNWNAILQDVSTSINIPIVMDVNKYGELELVAKTIMRKKGFTGRAKRLVVKSESMDEAFELMLDEATTLNVSNTPLAKARAYAEATFEKAGKTLDEVIPDFDKNYTALQKVMKRALNIPRTQMPVIEPADMKTFLTRIKSGSIDILQPWAKGKLHTPTKLNKQEGKEWVQLGFQDGDDNDDKLSAKLTRKPANKLLPTQSQIWLEKLIENIVKFGVPSSSSPIAKATIIVSKEGFILDGHHRFGQAMLANPTLALSTLSVPLDIKLLLKVGRAYGEAIGNTVKEADVEEGTNAVHESMASDKKIAALANRLIDRIEKVQMQWAKKKKVAEDAERVGSETVRAIRKEYGGAPVPELSAPARKKIDDVWKDVHARIASVETFWKNNADPLVQRLSKLLQMATDPLYSAKWGSMYKTYSSVVDRSRKLDLAQLRTDLRTMHIRPFGREFYEKVVRGRASVAIQALSIGDYFAVVKGEGAGYYQVDGSTPKRTQFTVRNTATNERVKLRAKEEVLPMSREEETRGRRLHKAHTKRMEKIAEGEDFGDTTDEGINDKYILKAVFLTGGAGAGKTFISDLMFGGTGLKVVNSDTQLERAMKAAGLDLKKDMPSRQVQREGGLRDKARDITIKRLDMYVTGRLGLVIDSTAAKVQKVEKQVAMLRKLGYDCSMVFVNTSLETSLARNQERPRTVPEAIVKKDWNLVQANLKKYRTLFGQKSFREIINDEVLSPKQVAARLTPQLTRIAIPMLNAPVTNPIGKKWMKDEKARLGISPTGAVMPLAASHDSEDLLTEDMSVTELECLYVDEMTHALQTAIQQNPNDVHRVAHHFGEFECAVEEGEFEKAEMLYRNIVKALPLDAVTERSMSVRHSQVSNVRRGTTKEIQSGSKNKGQVRAENRKRRIASRSKHKMTSSRVARTRRSMSRASESGHSVHDIEQAILDEVSPPGWEKRVEKMKRDPDITNPWKLAWYLHNKQKKNESIEETLLNGQYRGIVDVKTRKVVFKGKSRGEVVRELKRLRGPVPKGGWDEQRGGFMPIASYRKEVGDKWTEALPNESVDEAKQSTEIMRVSTYPKPTPSDGYGGAVACSPGAHSNYLFYDDGTVVRETHAEGKTTRTMLGRAGKLEKKLREIRSVVRKHIGDDETITYSLTVQEGRVVDEDTNVHGIKFEERQLVSMYDDEDEATRGTFEDWRAKHFSQLDEAKQGIVLTSQISKEGHAVRMKISGMVGRIAIKGEVRPLYMNISDAGTHRSADSDTTVNRADGYGKAVPFATRRKVVDAVFKERQKQFDLWTERERIRRRDESVDEGSADFTTLNDAAIYDDGYAKGSTEIWYRAGKAASALSRGLAFLQEHESENVPTLQNYKTSHKLVGEIVEKRPERIFGMMQGAQWSQVGEATTMLRRLGIHHTSMSVGDIIKTGNKVLFVDRDGFTPLS